MDEFQAGDYAEIAVRECYSMPEGTRGILKLHAFGNPKFFDFLPEDPYYDDISDPRFGGRPEWPVQRHEIRKVTE